MGKAKENKGKIKESKNIIENKKEREREREREKKFLKLSNEIKRDYLISRINKIKRNCKKSDKEAINKIKEIGKILPDDIILQRYMYKKIFKIDEGYNDFNKKEIDNLILTLDRKIFDYQENLDENTTYLWDCIISLRNCLTFDEKYIDEITSNFKLYVEMFKICLGKFEEFLINGKEPILEGDPSFTEKLAIFIYEVYKTKQDVCKLDKEFKKCFVDYAKYMCPSYNNKKGDIEETMLQISKL
jgi:hypothetical protein